MNKVKRKQRKTRVKRTKARVKSKRYSKNIPFNRKIKGKRTKRKSFRKRNLKGGSSLAGSQNSRQIVYSEGELAEQLDSRRVDAGGASSEGRYLEAIGSLKIFEVLEPQTNGGHTLFPVKIFIVAKYDNSKRVWVEPREYIIKMQWSKWEKVIQKLNELYPGLKISLPKYRFAVTLDKKKKDLSETLDKLKKNLRVIAEKHPGEEITELIYNIINVAWCGFGCPLQRVTAARQPLQDPGPPASQGLVRLGSQPEGVLPPLLADSLVRLGSQPEGVL